MVPLVKATDETQSKEEPSKPNILYANRKMAITWPSSFYQLSFTKRHFTHPAPPNLYSTLCGKISVGKNVGE